MSERRAGTSPLIVGKTYDPATATRLAPLSEPAERLQALREATRELVAAALRVVKVIDRSTVAVESLKDAIALADAELNREKE